MKREISCVLSGDKVVRTFTLKEDDGSIKMENTSVQGDKDVVLEQLEAQVVEATRDRDGILNPVTVKPAPSDGDPGEDVVFWLDAGTLHRVEIRRDRAGKFQSQTIQPIGKRNQRLEHAEERLAEITQERDAVKNAK